MNKKIYFPIAITFIVLCGVLLIVVVLQYGLIPEIRIPLFSFLEKESEEKSDQITEDEVKEKDLCRDKNGEKKDLCYFDTAKENRDSGLCDKIEQQGTKEACYEWVEFLLAYDEAEKKHMEYEIEPISNWKTFKDSELGFEIKYPSDFTLIEYDNKIEFSFPEINFDDTDLFLNQSGVFVYKNEKGYSCSSIQQFEDWDYEKISTSSGDIFYKDNWMGGGCGSGHCEFETSYRTIHNDYCYIVRLTMTNSSYSSPDFGSAWGRVPFDPEKLKETFNQMFSSFKFVD